LAIVDKMIFNWLYYETQKTNYNQKIIKKIPLLCLRNGISKSISCELPGYCYHD